MWKDGFVKCKNVAGLLLIALKLLFQLSLHFTIGRCGPMWEFLCYVKAALGNVSIVQFGSTCVFPTLNLQNCKKIRIWKFEKGKKGFFWVNKKKIEYKPHSKKWETWICHHKHCALWRRSPVRLCTYNHSRRKMQIARRQSREMQSAACPASHSVTDPKQWFPFRPS